MKSDFPVWELPFCFVLMRFSAASSATRSVGRGALLARFGGGFDRDGTSRIHRSPAALDREAACFEERDEAVGELALKFEGAGFDFAAATERFFQVVEQ